LLLIASMASSSITHVSLSLKASTTSASAACCSKLLAAQATFVARPIACFHVRLARTPISSGFVDQLGDEDTGEDVVRPTVPVVGVVGRRNRSLRELNGVDDSVSDSVKDSVTILRGDSVRDLTIDGTDFALFVFLLLVLARFSSVGTSMSLSELSEH